MKNKIIKEDIILINELINKVIGNYEIKNIERLGGLTNHSYQVELENSQKYVVRLPGEGTSEMINRNDEKVSTELAYSLGIDARLLYFGEDGSKVSEFINNAITCNADMLREEKTIKDVAKIFHTLHTCGQDTHVPFEVFDMAKGYEEIIYGHHVNMYDDYQEVKNAIMKIKEKLDIDTTIQKVPCHNDSLCENWIYGDNQLYLIDWEYAGMNDGMWDLADVSIEANYNDEQDEILLKEYLGKEPSLTERQRFISNKLYLDYLWTLWGKTRVPYDGDEMEEYALNRYIRLKSNLKKFNG